MVFRERKKLSLTQRRDEKSLKIKLDLRHFISISLRVVSSVETEHIEFYTCILILTNYVFGYAFSVVVLDDSTPLDIDTETLKICSLIS